MTDRRFLLVANPVARGGAGEVAAQVVATIGDSGASVDVLETAAPGATETVPGLAAALEHPRPEAVLAVGGDGTARAVAESIARAVGTWHADTLGDVADVPPLLIVPGGTGNSMYRELWADAPWPEALASLLEGRSESRRIDLYRIVEADRAVLLGASTGFFRWTLDATSRFPDLSGRELYLAAGAAVAEELSPYEGSVEVDGTEIVDGPIMLVAVGGAPHRSGTIHVLPGSELDDGLLDVCVLAVGTREAFFTLMGKAAAGDHVGEPGAVFARGRRVTLTSAGSALPFEHDGEIWPRDDERITIEVVPRAIVVAATFRSHS